MRVHTILLLLLGALIAAVNSGSANTKNFPSPLNGAEDAPSHFTKQDGINIHYKSLGEGKTAMVFIHGWTCDMTFWRYQVPAFEGKIRIILIDLPGHGKSGKPEIPYTMDLFAKSVNAVLEDAGVDQAVLVGHSMGTPVIRQFYRLFPKKTRALVAMDGSLRPFITDPAQIEKFLSSFSSPDYKENINKGIDSMFTPQTAPEIRNSVKTVMQSAPQYVAVSAMKSMFDPNIWKDDKIDVPLQLILAKSPFWNADYEAYVRKLAPQVDY